MVVEKMSEKMASSSAPSAFGPSAQAIRGHQHKERRRQSRTEGRRQAPVVKRTPEAGLSTLAKVKDESVQAVPLGRIRRAHAAWLLAILHIGGNVF